MCSISPTTASPVAGLAFGLLASSFDIRLASRSGISGLYWRKIAQTRTLSFHAFGAAVDIVSSNPRHRETYWLWARARDKEWYTRPLSRRHMPPESFVEIFEKHGYVWGGKWLFYDTIHFEYRPDVLLFNGLTLEGPATSVKP